MAPVATPFFFYLLSGIMLIGGILVITRKNPVHSALALIVTLLAQASIYLMLYAPFVAGVQIILYAGGIMVLFLFVIMLVSIDRSIRERQFNSQWVAGVIAATALISAINAATLKPTQCALCWIMARRYAIWRTPTYFQAICCSRTSA